MINLIQFHTYEINIKVLTFLDKMPQTLLNI